MKTKLLILTLIAASMTGCATKSVPLEQPTAQLVQPPKDGIYKLQGYKGPEAMENQEVMQAAKDCINHKMRPEISYLMVRTDQGKVRVPVNVTCEPY
jgi:predicted small lipoprotein YifL